MKALETLIHRMIDEHALTRATLIYRMFDALLVLIGIGAAIAGTQPSLPPHVVTGCLYAIAVIWALFVLDYLSRLWVAPLDRDLSGQSVWAVRREWIGSRIGIIDLVTVLPIALGALVADWTPTGAPLLAVLWIARFARYTTGLDMLWRVAVRERQPVLGVFLIFLLVLLVASVLAYHAEREVQPDRFGSLSMALWWAVTTLTTTGYGDTVPLTPFGRLLGGIVMVCGITVFGLLAGILATGFSNELRRRDFLRNWDLVAQVPFLHDVGPGAIADLANMLRPREVPARTVLARRGQPGDCMYFIVQGEVEAAVKPKPQIMGPGEFFGEIALLTGGPRTATVVTLSQCQLLALDIADFRAIAASRPELLAVIQTEADRRLGLGGRAQPAEKK
ncbi:cyclic nucleotide-binding protein [Aliidongia dinghuensis]|uniref:Cyclic nucleotide-binding protein n=1 Tax=Aliidongia dinghuensis TaxID=1867774 RepID=A0A8J2YQQ3_9PROT|nr:cyclic nucleotide-gated ion channel [Aliidongia dinghuensis]GGF09391.1 cyclic nucleotide-binding protein [Aliidongia dinghuensis]